MKNTFLTITAVLILGLISGITAVNAKSLSAEDDMSRILEALPELNDELNNAEVDRSAVIRIKCYVDTPAYDVFSYNHCFSSGSAYTTTAVFNLENVPAGSVVIWSHPNCSASSTWCNFPISQYHTVNVSATILKPDSTWSIVEGSARYEGWR